MISLLLKQKNKKIIKLRRSIKSFPKRKKNIRNLQFNFRILPNLKKLIFFKDLPLHFKLRKFKYRRLLALFYGLKFDPNAVNYNL
jgi:hypothetical protein